MHMARVIGTVVSARKDERLDGNKLLLLQPLSGSGESLQVAPVIAVDTVGAGVEQEIVIYATGSSARVSVGNSSAPVDAAVVGIVDHWNVLDEMYQGAD